jgi:hypothetical protein
MCGNLIILHCLFGNLEEEVTAIACPDCTIYKRLFCATSANGVAHFLTH